MGLAFIFRLRRRYQERCFIPSRRSVLNCAHAPKFFHEGIEPVGTIALIVNSFCQLSLNSLQAAYQCYSYWFLVGNKGIYDLPIIFP